MAILASLGQRTLGGVAPYPIRSRSGIVASVAPGPGCWRTSECTEHVPGAQPRLTRHARGERGQQCDPHMVGDHLAPCRRLGAVQSWSAPRRSLQNWEVQLLNAAWVLDGEGVPAVRKSRRSPG